ncbi:MAG TPA: sigma-54-dependent Fis family transcriptional regulator, partial [Bdellovibrionales bacterium]|nr:sigma-54-dependent Fis family transcriptional regulator [Bdellovibrionales bacterium]
MKSPLKIYALTKDQAAGLSLTSATGLGGAASSGVPLKGLKEKDDYVIVSPAGDKVVVHGLKGSRKGAIELMAGEHLIVQDLTLLVLRESASESPSNGAIDDLTELVAGFSEPDDLSRSMQTLLDKLLRLAQMEKGLVINKTLKGDFHVVSQKGVSPNDPWMSESLVLETLDSREPRFVQNIVGSRYESKRSLVATGFISVFAWPLVVRGETLGVLLVGSSKPHSGLSEAERQQAAVYTRLGALMLSFYLRDQKSKEEVQALRRSMQPDEVPLLTESKELLQTCELARRVAASDLAVLVHGETGVGKEVLASWIHQKSDRAKGPFVPVNCGAIPSELLESLLFGHRRGAFTGALADQTGKFQQADGGTLFLDEIGDLSEHLQVKLLRVLQEKTVEPLGSNKATKIDVRIVAATHKDLQQLVEQGKFREDLYYRLAEMTLTIPPLRERPGDILLLATMFLKNFAPQKRFSHKAWEWLKAQEWRGNVRELMSCVKRASVLATSEEIQPQDLRVLTSAKPVSEKNW